MAASTVAALAAGYGQACGTSEPRIVRAPDMPARPRRPLWSRFPRKQQVSRWLANR